MKDIHSFVILAYKESLNLEECIKSIKKQSVKSNVFIVTSTPNDYIMELASQYGLGVMINSENNGKSSDYNFALSSVETPLLTIAHQDDLYDRNYAKEIINTYKKNKDAVILFTDYYEIIGDRKIKNNSYMFKKRLLTNLLRYSKFNKKKYWKRLAVKYQQAICTSSVTFVKSNLQNNPFSNDFVCHSDWDFFEKLSVINKRFILIPKKLVGYRNDEIKNKSIAYYEEKKIIYKKFWPSWLIELIYRRR